MMPKKKKEEVKYSITFTSVPLHLFQGFNPTEHQLLNIYVPKIFKDIEHIYI